MAKNQDTKALQNQIREFRRKLTGTQKRLTQVQKKRLKDLAAYEWKTIKNSFRKGGKKEAKGDDLYVYTPEGEKLMTVAEFLKGSYRATGHGTRQKKMRYEGTRPGGDLGRRKKENQRDGTFTQGTGKFSEKERENIRAVHRKKITQKRLDREIKRLKAETERLKAEKKKEELKAAKSRLRKLETQSRKNENLKRTNQRRIVARSKHDVAARDVQTHRTFRIPSLPGEAPRSWGPSYYLRNHVRFDPSEDGDGWVIHLSPETSGDDLLHSLEYGGHERRFAPGGEAYGRGDHIGYTVVSESESGGSTGRRGRKVNFSHKRVSLRKRYGPPVDIDIAPRPVFEPARERIEQRIPELFGDIADLLD